MKENPWTIPNVLSAYRIVAVPAIVWAIVSGHRMTFAVLILVNFVTDILDGLLARALKQETAIGAKLDSVADLCTLALIVAGFLCMELPFVEAHAWAFALLAGLLVLTQAWSLLRFRRVQSMHLYSSKIAGYFLGFFFADYYLFGSHAWWLYSMFVVCLLNLVEELIVTSLLQKAQSNARGLYWVLQERRRNR